MADVPASLHFSQSDIVTLEIGESKTVFRAHRDLLRAKSKFFEGCLGSQFNEAVENKVLLKEDSPVAVAAFLDWLYHKKPVVDVGHGSRDDLASIYCFADKVCAESYHNDLMDAIREACKAQNVIPSNVVIMLSDAGLFESQLAKFLIDGWAWETVNFPKLYIDGKLSKDIKDWSAHPEILPSFLRSTWKDQHSSPTQRPMDLDGCHYHVHADGSNCSDLDKSSS